MGSQPNKSLIDGIRCLQELVMAGEPVGCHEMARRLKIHPVRANRLLMTLDEIGLARRDEQRKYSPGPAIHVLAVQTLHGSAMFRSFLPFLEDLGRQRPWVVAMGVLWQDMVCYFYHGRPLEEGGMPLGHGRTFPASRSSIGLVLLAALPQTEVIRIYEGKAIDGFDEPEHFYEELERIRQRGYARIPPRDSAETVTKNFAVAVGNPPFAAISYSAIPLDVPDEEVVSLLKAGLERYGFN
ncbi:MAG: transcriptional regulator, partial [Lentisphaerae bacterium]